MHLCTRRSYFYASFFYAYGTHPDLHSFPTRRSSDLPIRSCAAPRCTTSSTSAPAASRTSRMRSEEHTSELQSQSNLVCRLLLEKKKFHLRLLPTDSQLTPFTLALAPVPSFSRIMLLL